MGRNEKVYAVLLGNPEGNVSKRKISAGIFEEYSVRI
jgi:hypothetical protein